MQLQFTKQQFQLLIVDHQLMVFHYQIWPFLGRTPIPAKWNPKIRKATIPLKSVWKFLVNLFLGHPEHWVKGVLKKKKRHPILSNFVAVAPFTIYIPIYGLPTLNLSNEIKCSNILTIPCQHGSIAVENFMNTIFTIQDFLSFLWPKRCNANGWSIMDHSFG